jgi:hypothetical protein
MTWYETHEGETIISLMTTLLETIDIRHNEWMF